MPAFGFTFYARSIVDGLLHKPTLQTGCVFDESFLTDNERLYRLYVSTKLFSSREKGKRTYLFRSWWKSKSRDSRRIFIQLETLVRG